MRTLLPYRFPLAGPTGTDEVLVLFACSDTIEADELDDFFERELDRDIPPERVLILARERAIAALHPVVGEGRYRTALERLHPRTTVELSGFGPDGSEKAAYTVRGTATTRIPYHAFRNRMLTSIFARRGGFVHGTESYHFSNPSGRHTNRFLRLSKALVARVEISFFAFCCLPFLSNVRVAYVDTPALYALVAAVNEHRASFGDGPMHADCFGSYGSVRQYGFSNQRDAAVLISASSSGLLAREVASAAPHIMPARIFHVVYLGPKSGWISVCNLAHDAKSNPEGEQANSGDYRDGACKMCDAGSIPIPLQGEHFEIPAPQPSPLIVKQEDAPKDLSPLMGELAGKGVFSVGLGEGRGSGPKLFNIVADRLISSEVFEEKLQYALARVLPAYPQAVVSLDKASRTLAERIARDLPSRPQFLDPANLPESTPSTQTGAVVIVAAATESGRSLQDISRDLRTAFAKAPQIYIIGFSKSQSSDARTALRNSLIKTSAVVPHDLAIMYSCLLPPSGHANAWSNERNTLRLLSASPPPGADDEGFRLLMERLKRLETGSEPLTDDLFIENSPQDQLRLQPGFVFWPRDLPGAKHSQADVFFTIASVLANLRSSQGPRSLEPNRFQHRLLDPANFTRFNDGIIQASLLRAANPRELNYAADLELSRNFVRVARKVIEGCAGRPKGAASAEFLMAILSRQARVHRDHEDEIARLVPDAPPKVAALVSALQQKLAADRQGSTAAKALSRPRRSRASTSRQG